MPRETVKPSQTLTPTLGAPICPAKSEAPASFHPPSMESFRSLAEAFEPQILDYLNSQGSADGLQIALSSLSLNLDDIAWKTKAQVYTIDATNDSVPDIIIGLIFSTDEYDFSDGFLWVFSCSEGKFQKVHSEYIGSIQFSENDGIREVRDMNLNHIPEIVYSYIDNVGAHGYFTRPFFILEWDGTHFADLIEYKGFYDPSVTVAYATVYNGDGDIIDTDGDDTLELVLSNGIAGHYGGPQRRRTDILAWNGEAYSLSRWEYEPATYRFQAVQDGDDATRFGDYQQALASYQKAIFDEALFGWQAGYYLDLYAPTPPVPDPDERPRLEAYARYRIVLLHTVQGNFAAAQTVYETLQMKFQPDAVGYPYAELAAAFWNEFILTEDISSACRKAIDYAGAHEEDLLGPLGPGFYGVQGFYYSAEDLCPFISSTE